MASWSTTAPLLSSTPLCSWALALTTAPATSNRPRASGQLGAWSTRPANTTPRKVLPTSPMNTLAVHPEGPGRSERNGQGGNGHRHAAGHQAIEAVHKGGEAAIGVSLVLRRNDLR